VPERELFSEPTPDEIERLAELGRKTQVRCQAKDLAFYPRWPFGRRFRDGYKQCTRKAVAGGRYCRQHAYLERAT
jgi:hypothetical protein